MNTNIDDEQNFCLYWMLIQNYWSDVNIDQYISLHYDSDLYLPLKAALASEHAFTKDERFNSSGVYVKQ